MGVSEAQVSSAICEDEFEQNHRLGSWCEFAAGTAPALLEDSSQQQRSTSTQLEEVTSE